MVRWVGVYNTGTATVAAGGTTVTIAGAGNLQALVSVGDTFRWNGLEVRITAIPTGSTLTLAQGWPGAALTASPYEIAFTPYDSGYRQGVQEILDRFGTGVIGNIAGVAPVNSSLMGFDATGAFVQRNAAQSQSFLNLIPQESPSDATAGRLLTPGAFGWGAGSVSIGSHNLNNDLPNGSYYLSSPVNSPDGNGWLLQMKLNAIYVVQKFWSVATGYEWKRSCLNGAWQTWVRQEVLRGVNPSGTWIRYPDGTQICTRLVRISSPWVATSWGGYVDGGNFSFAVPFAEVPVVNTTSQDVNIGGRSGYSFPLNVTSTTINLWMAGHGTAYATNGYVDTNIIAIGRYTL